MKMHKSLSAPFLFILLAASAFAKPIGVELPRRNAYGDPAGPAKSSVTIPSSGKGEPIAFTQSKPPPQPTTTPATKTPQGYGAVEPPKFTSTTAIYVEPPKTYPAIPPASVDPVKPTQIAPPAYQTPSIPAVISPTTYSKPPTPTPQPQNYYSNNNKKKTEKPSLPPTEGSGGSYRLRIRGGIGSGVGNAVDKLGDAISGGGGKKKKGGSGSGSKGSTGSAPKPTAASHKPSEASVKKSSQPTASATAATKVSSASASASKTRTGGGDGPKVTGVPSAVKSGGVKDPKATGKSGSGSVPRPKDTKDKDLGVGLDARGYMRGGAVLAGLVVGFLVVA
ncbi:hypothetical protein FQN51_008844 [Onygenales sp. PD_10]|nr:hypothetical protein FQN51_008844 [Onygenales sp. PD_10]